VTSRSAINKCRVLAGDDPGPSLWARRLGYGGLIPFVGLTAALWITRPGEWSFASAALLGYSAIIASFLGAIHWGLLMRPSAAQPLPALMWGVTPGLLGWVALLLDPAAGLALIAMLLWVCFAVDRVLYPRYQLQAWLPMRLWLTLTASSSCLAAAIALQ
jgi:Protein of unknown function (DUF3429)